MYSYRHISCYYQPVNYLLKKKLTFYEIKIKVKRKFFENLFKIYEQFSTKDIYK